MIHSVTLIPLAYSFVGGTNCLLLGSLSQIDPGSKYYVLLNRVLGRAFGNCS